MRMFVRIVVVLLALCGTLGAGFLALGAQGMPPGRLMRVLCYLGALPLAGVLAFFVRPKARPSLANAEA